MADPNPHLQAALTRFAAQPASRPIKPRNSPLPSPMTPACCNA